MLNFIILTHICKSHIIRLRNLVFIPHSSIKELSVSQNWHIELRMKDEVISSNINYLSTSNLIIPTFLVCNVLIWKEVENLIWIDIICFKFDSQKRNRWMIRIIFSIDLNTWFFNNEFIAIITLLDIHQFLDWPIKFFDHSLCLSLKWNFIFD